MAFSFFEETEHASVYAQHRPHCNIKVRSVIKSFMEKHGCGLGCVVDLGTGSGQALAYWTRVFRKCVGDALKHLRTREKQMSSFMSALLKTYL